ncbi:hypothetical protein Hanom_Chr05g00416761 [Helianthus anomalus]
MYYYYYYYKHQGDKPLHSLSVIDFPAMSTIILKDPHLQKPNKVLSRRNASSLKQ